MPGISVAVGCLTVFLSPRHHRERDNMFPAHQAQFRLREEPVSSATQGQAASSAGSCPDAGSPSYSLQRQSLLDMSLTAGSSAMVGV
ncbi:cell division cycle-associated protein 4 isoform X1 [Lates japonicus]|uniref:Cell division cycle-associated protein 4 isoform X1 n=1 Tax=Lates japonicus TaxID=270547 RepID=A0AAD3M575_LATJO|nr:cell division cycle-associated protein 4 isoform X1 [Lates japonicus]